MIKFRRYPDITNSYDEKKVKSFLMNGADKHEFVCFRKIDGSNFQITIDRNGEIRYGKRSCYIGETDGFGNFMEVMNRYEIPKKMKKIAYDYFDVIDEDFDSITLFGELLGGYYQHEDVKHDVNASCIQGRISYSPKNEFIAFDLRFNHKDENNDAWLSASNFSFLCKKIGIPGQIREFCGSFKECLDFDISSINDNTGNLLFGYPEVKNNLIEGVVIKPLYHDLRGKYNERIILKHKNKEFTERQFKPKERKIQELSEREQKWFDILNEYMNENRVMSAVSKVGKDNFGLLIRESIADALEDFKKDNGDNIDLTKDEYKIVCKHFSRGAVEIVRKVYLS